MRRREFIAFLGIALVDWPTAGHAQRIGPPRRVAVLSALSADNAIIKMRLNVLERELVQLGWLPGQNLNMDYRFGAEQSDQYPLLAREIVATRPDAIIAHTTQVARVVQQVTRDIPVVFFDVSDPIGTGLIASVARPAGNITGVLLYEPGIVSKWLEMLREISTQVKRAVLLGNPKTTAFSYFQRAAQAAAPSIPIELVEAPVANAAEIEEMFRSIASATNSGVVVLPDPTNVAHRQLIIALAERHRVPAVYPFRLFTNEGGLMAYETDQTDISRLVAYYVDRILRGANPADLPVQVPTKYKTILNLKVAKAIGLDVPRSLLLRADEVIE